jgi:hypothetical protein
MLSSTLNATTAPCLSVVIVRSTRRTYVESGCSLVPITTTSLHNTAAVIVLVCVYVGGTRPESPSHTTTATSTTNNTSTTAATSSQSLATFLRKIVTSIVAAIKEALRHLIACIPDDLDLEHRYDKLSCSNDTTASTTVSKS